MHRPDGEFHVHDFVRTATLAPYTSSLLSAVAWGPVPHSRTVGGRGSRRLRVSYHWVYGALLRPASDGTLVPDLAASAEVVDEGTIAVQLRDGVTLSDGNPFDAELVKRGPVG